MDTTLSAINVGISAHKAIASRVLGHGLAGSNLDATTVNCNWHASRFQVIGAVHGWQAGRCLSYLANHHPCTLRAFFTITSSHLSSGIVHHPRTCSGRCSLPTRRHCNDVGVLRGKRREFYVAGLQSWRNNSDALVALTLVELAPV